MTSSPPPTTPRRSLAQRTLILAVLAYRATLARWLAGQCRFHPTCSQFAIEAVSQRGARRGGWLALKRIARCHPWGPTGYDPVPPDPNPTNAHTPSDPRS